MKGSCLYFRGVLAGAVLFLLFLGCSNPQAAFDEAETKKSKALYKEFIEKFPDSELVAKANNRILDIEAWEKIIQNPTEDALNNYVKEFSDGLYIGEAKRNKEIIKAYHMVKKEDTVKAYSGFLERYKGSLFEGKVQKSIVELKEHPVYSAKITRVSTFARFNVRQETKKSIVFGLDKGAYGAWVNYKNGNLLNGLAARGAYFVIDGKVDGFLGYDFESDDKYPLILVSTQKGLRYVCGNGKIKQNGMVLDEFSTKDVKTWSEKLEKGTVFQRRAAAQALGWIGTPEEVLLLAKALEDEDLLVKLFVSESLMKVGDKRAMNHLVVAKKKVDEAIKKDKSKYGNGQFYYKFEIETEAPFTSWYDAKFKLFLRGVVRNEKTAILVLLQDMMGRAISEISVDGQTIN